MKGLRSIPRILQINQINGYLVSCLFNNGESRVIDFYTLFKDTFKVQEGDPAFTLLHHPEAFQHIQILLLFTFHFSLFTSYLCPLPQTTLSRARANEREESPDNVERHTI